MVRCSSGEEPHSPAIAFAEVREARPDLPACELQIFANGLNADAIAAAHSGRLASTIDRDLTPQRLARHFTKGADGFVIDKRIRDSVLSAQHDVILDPPFTRLDLLSCRNLLIYFSAAPQRHLSGTSAAPAGIRTQRAVALRTALRQPSAVELDGLAAR